MPLHLLGKKSWNVYNVANIEKVRRDEAEAKATEEFEEERMQAIDAEQRMQILRGEKVSPVAVSTIPKKRNLFRHEHSGREKKIRKKLGENDTDYEMRLARQKAEQALAVKNQFILPAPKTPRKYSEIEKYKDDSVVESVTAGIKQGYDDQFKNRSSNVIGLKHNMEQLPWYSRDGIKTRKDIDGLSMKNVWGNDDLRRLQRERERIRSNDPLAVMKAGATRVREVENERRRWKENENIEKQILKNKKSQREQKRSRRHDNDCNETLSLDSRKEKRKSPKRWTS